jgi:sucrose-6-phosphate hydrolase SacC (GH32 family)
MCRENKVCIFLLLPALLLLSARGVLHGQEQWYLITESELRSIEEYRRNSEAEKQTWLSQAQKLSVRAGSLEAESASLNSQLQNQQELNRQLTLSFNGYEQEQSLLLSRKDTQIARLETENEGKDRAIVRLVTALAITGAGIIGYSAFKILKIFRV